MELEVRLAGLGWSKGELSRRLGIHRNTISRWKVIPGYVEAYLDLAVEYEAYRAKVRKLALEVIE